MTDINPTATLFETLSAFFSENEWLATRLGEEPVLQLAFQGTNGRWLCFAQAREEMRQVVFYSVAPIQVPAEKRAAVAEFTTRANYGLILGNFELDFGDGELRYKTSLDIEGVDLVPAMLQPLTFVNVSTMDRYLPGLMAVVYGGQSPEAAVEQIEAEGGA
jgi:hypothetical protein